MPHLHIYLMLFQSTIADDGCVITHETSACTPGTESINYLSSSSEDDITPMKRKRANIIDSDDSGSEDKQLRLEAPKKSKFVLKNLPNSIVKKPTKTEDDKVPLPDPFILPKNYTPDVVSALKLGKMTLQTNKAFLSAVASSMFESKLYPSTDDYNNVARSIIAKYPFMKSPTGKPYVSSYNLSMYVCSISV